MRSARETERRHVASGYTMVELLVSMTIGLIILAALVTVFAGNSRERGEIERSNEQTENGRYALQLLS
ncbi:MAG TPA: prepilin-type N-terminal cleavage/methylation domain-containing protein, partial [Steroidobacteraceae bacterium]|nr:prepilin-type N-terminal cleavage/methylation domain-containing protein [Steroidobacteraceae bacterium]